MQVRLFLGVACLSAWVAAEEQQEQMLSTSAAMRNIGEELKSLTIPGLSRYSGEATGRRMIVENLMRTVTGVDKLNPQQTEIMGNISDLLESILADFLLERASDQADLDLILTQWPQCFDTAREVVDEGLANDTADAQAAHEACRNEESYMFNHTDTHCSTLDEWMASTSMPDCVLPSPTQDSLETWQNWFDAGYQWFHDAIIAFEPLRDNCLSADSGLTDKIDQCNNNQTTFESLFCQWRLHRDVTCPMRNTCYDQLEAAHNQVVAQITPLANKRVDEARMITYINCLVEQMYAGAATINLTACAPLQVADYSQYDNVYPTIPARINCTLDDVNPYPGHADFNTTYYGSLPPNAPPADTGAHCYTT